MKKQFLLALSLFVAVAGFAQKAEKAVKAPAAVLNSFEQAHPGAKGSWEKEGRNYEVDFTEGGKKMSCVLNPAGTIIETETETGLQGLPASARAYLRKHYPHQKVKDAARIEKSDGTVQFEAGIGKKDIIFDANGDFIKEAKD